MDPYAAFRSRDFRLLLAGNFLAAFGFQMLSVAVGWDLYLATRSPLVLGNVGFAQVAPFLLFALTAGQLADRMDRRRILLATQALFLISSALLTLSFRSVWLIYGCLFLTATARTFQGPARSALLPKVVGLAALRNAITWNSSTMEIANVTGPALAGLLIATTGSRGVYVMQGVCAIATLLCFALLSVRSEQPGEGAPPAGIRSLFDGIAFVVKNKLVLSTMSLDMFAVLFGGAVALLPIFADDILHIGPKGLGWLRAAQSIGAVCMAVLQAHVIRIHHAGRVLLWSIAGFGVAIIVFGLSRSIWLSFAALVVAGALDNISVVLRHSLIQTETPDAVRGRVLAVNNIFISCSNQLGAVESGWAAAIMGTAPSVAFGGVVTILIAGFFALRFKPLRDWVH